MMPFAEEEAVSGMSGLCWGGSHMETSIADGGVKGHPVLGPLPASIGLSGGPQSLAECFRDRTHHYFLDRSPYYP
jgi:hypothetical protein